MVMVMEPNKRRPPSAQAGFTLVELMVGLAIGLVATVVIIQVITVFEAQRRSTTGSADAQTNGGIALYTIARELQQAGYPLVPVTSSPLECTALTINGTADASTPNRLSPVVITNGVAATGVNASDSITIRYGTGTTGGVPGAIGAVAGNVVTLGTALAPGSNLGCNQNDNTLIVNAAACYMSSVNAAVAVAAAGTPPSVTLLNATGAVVGANFSCVGNWTEVTYAVNQATGNLERTVRTNFGAASTTPVLTGIVNLQAQYGVSAAANSNQVTAWVSASGGTWATPAVADRNRIKSVRLAVVARNPKTEPSNVTSACSSTTAAVPTGLCAWAGSVASPAPTLDLSAADANWARYRYRVFETIIPLRNVVWAKDTL